MLLELTKDPELEDYILVMQYASEGDLHNFLQKKFTEIEWNKKSIILWQISEGYLCLNYLTTFYKLSIHSINLLIFILLDLRLFIIQILYIEIFIAETYYMIYLV